MPGWLSSIFGDTRQQDTQATQQAQSRFGLTPQVQDYWSSISGQFSPQSWSAVGADPYQTAAAQAQAGYASGLNPAFGAATGIAQGGISTGDINRFMSPYTQNVVDTTMRQLDFNNAVSNTNNQAQAAKLGALSGTNPIVARSLATRDQNDLKARTAAGLYNQGYQQAADMAGRSTQAQLGGIGAASGVAGQQAGINQGQFGMGSAFTDLARWNAMMPYQIGQMGAQTLGSLVQGSGQSSTGSSTGTSTQTATPSPFSVGMGLLGGALTAGWRPFGAKDGGRIEMADGGAISAPADPHEKFVKAFDTISGLISRSKGGSVMKPYAEGGPVGTWETTVQPASPGFDWSGLGKGMSEMGRKGQGPQAANDDMGLGAAQANLSSFMNSTVRPRFAVGGSPSEWGERGPSYPESSSGLSPMFAGVSRADLAPIGSLDRSSFAGQLEDPKTRSALLALAHAEVGGQGPEAQQAFLETVFNRAAARGKSLSDTIYDRGYYPSVTYDRMGGAIPEARYVPILDKVMGGSNVAKYATGNASGTVGFNGGPQTVAFNGERFGIEGPDRKWATTSGLPNMGADPEGARLAASMRAPESPTPRAPVVTASARAPESNVATPEKERSWLDYLLPGRNEGVWDGKPATRMQRIGTALMSTSSPTMRGPMEGVAQNVMAWEANRQKEREINQAAEALAGQITINGKTVPSVAGRNVALGEALNPAQIRQADAAAKKLELDADKDFQLEFLRKKAEADREVARADLEERFKLLDRIMPPQTPIPSGGSNTRMQWRPTPQAPQQAAPQPVVPQTPIGPQPSPIPAPPSYQPPPDSPAGKAAAKRIEAGSQMRASAEKRQAEQRAMQGQFDADAGKLSPYDFVQKYGNQRQNLTSAQISRLNQMIDAVTRGP